MIDMFVLRKLIYQGFHKYSRDKVSLDMQQVQEKYDQWFGGNNNTHWDQPYALDRLRDMFEEDWNPINEKCSQCQKLGNVCFKYDQGHSHRISQGGITN